jgi:hypothetical protein
LFPVRGLEFQVRLGLLDLVRLGLPVLPDPKALREMGDQKVVGSEKEEEEPQRYGHALASLWTLLRKLIWLGENCLAIGLFNRQRCKLILVCLEVNYSARCDKETRER